MNLQHPLHDIGANLTNTRLIDNIDTLLAQAIETGIRRIDVTGTSMQSSLEAQKLTHKFPDLLKFTAGIHPHNASTWGTNTRSAISQLIHDPLCSMVGECGLDYFRMISTKHEQTQCFEEQLELASLLQEKPVFLHCREAFEDFYSILNSHAKRSNNPLLVHCYTLGVSETKKLIDLGCYFGITGWICDKRRNQDLLSSLNLIPIDRLFIETDAPYLNPVKTREINYPHLLPFVLAKLAETKNLSPSLLAEQLWNNQAQMFQTIPSIRLKAHMNT